MHPNDEATKGVKHEELTHEVITQHERVIVGKSKSLAEEFKIPREQRFGPVTPVTFSPRKSSVQRVKTSRGTVYVQL